MTGGGAGGSGRFAQRVRPFVAPFRTPAERTGTWTFAQELIASSAWYASLWQRRERITDTPSLLLWGMKDPAFKPDVLARWREALPHARVREFPDAGHFVMEEAPVETADAVREFLAAQQLTRAARTESPRSQSA